MELLADLTLILAAALGGGFLARWLGQPLIVGYILAGVAVGPFTGGFTVSHVEGIEQLAELGVVLLLFALGLEVSFRELAPVRAVATVGAVIEIVLTIVLGFAMATVLGWPREQALWFGALISLSSTMVALKTLQAQGRLGTLSSRVMLGTLVVQDLAVVPMMIILPELHQPAGGPVRLLLSTGKAFALLGVIVFAATRLVPRTMAAVARSASRELFLLTTTALALGVGYAAWSFGLSVAIGAFIAGLVINESEYAHQALSDITPLRDLFGMLFFVSVGMLLDPNALWQHLGAVAMAAAAVSAGKALIVGGVVRAFGYSRVVPLAAGLTLFQVGEFAFVLARVGVNAGIVADELYSLVLNTAVTTMVLTPIVSGTVPWIYSRVTGRRTMASVERIDSPAPDIQGHVVIAGAGRVGRTAAAVLAGLEVPLVLIEVDGRSIEQARRDGFPVIAGDASHRGVLRAANLDRARALLVTAAAVTDVRSVVETARQLAPGVPIVARAEGPEARLELLDLALDEVVCPELEAAIEMTRVGAVHLDVPVERFVAVAGEIRMARRQRPERG